MKLLATTASQYLRMNREEFMSAMHPYFSEGEMGQIEAAYFFSKYAHRGQTRESGIRYFEHPRAVAWILFDELHIVDWQIIAVALLHDIIEDSFIMKVQRLEINFGKTVAMDVKYLSKSKELSDIKYWQRFYIVNSWRAVVCKLADRLHNLRTLSVCSEEKQLRKISETEQFVFPLFELARQSAPRRYKDAVLLLCDLILAEIQELKLNLR